VRRPEYDKSESYWASAGLRIQSCSWPAHRKSLQDLDCSTVPSATGGGRLSRLLIKRADPKPAVEHNTDDPPTQPFGMISPAPSKVCYGDKDTDPVSDPSLLDVPSSQTEAAVAEAMSKMF
jgi:hypothetical protein